MDVGNGYVMTGTRTTMLGTLFGKVSLRRAYAGGQGCPGEDGL
jgi:hypothetical protein